MRRKLYLETFGCQMNVLDSELVLGQLRAHGYEQVDDRLHADVILYNTCSVREHAEQKVWSRLGELRGEKKTKPHLVIGVIGCMAEREGPGIFKKYPHIDILCGPAELDKLPGLVHNAVVTKGGFRVQGSGFSDPDPDEKGTGVFFSDSVRSSEFSKAGESDLNHEPRTLNPIGRQVALMGAATRRSSTLAAATDTLELLDLSRSVSPTDDIAQAYVRITRGCNKYCTYCVVPYTRGPEVHRPPKNIIDEVKMLVDAGAKEVTLLGQTVNHYHYRPESGSGETTFADLLYMVHESVPDLPRLRFVTSFPRDFTDAALQAMRDCPRICRYLHVPAQSASDRILRMMNRGYTSQQYYDFIARAKALMPDISLASDFIVGFPTETEEDHQKTLDLIRHCRFKNSFIFKYSPRPGTTAIDRFEDDVPEDVKRRRNNEMLAVQQQVSQESNRALIGKTVEVLVECESKLVSRQSKTASSFVQLTLSNSPFRDRPQGDSPPHRTTQLVGRTRGDQVVCFDGELSLKGEILEVQITDAQNLTLFGKLAAVPALPT